MVQCFDRQQYFCCALFGISKENCDARFNWCNKICCQNPDRSIILEGGCHTNMKNLLNPTIFLLGGILYAETHVSKGVSEGQFQGKLQDKHLAMSNPHNVVISLYVQNVDGIKTIKHHIINLKGRYQTNNLNDLLMEGWDGVLCKEGIYHKNNFQDTYLILFRDIFVSDCHFYLCTEYAWY